MRNLKESQCSIWRCQWSVCTPIPRKIMPNDFLRPLHYFQAAVVSGRLHSEHTAQSAHASAQEFSRARYRDKTGKVIDLLRRGIDSGAKYAELGHWEQSLSGSGTLGKQRWKPHRRIHSSYHCSLRSFMYCGGSWYPSVSRLLL